MESEFNIIISKKEETTPGPGSYSINSTFGKVPKIVFKFRKQTFEKIDERPIMGVTSMIGKGPKCKILTKPKEPQQFNTPGPNFVPPPFGKNSIKISFNKSKYTQRKISISPGPSDYVYNYNEFGKNSSKVSIHTNGGSGINWTNLDSPGPASYGIKFEKIFSKSPSYTISNKYEKPKEPISARLAPPRNSLSGPKWTMPKTGRIKINH